MGSDTGDSRFQSVNTKQKPNMGAGKFDPTSYHSFARASAHKSVDEVYTSRTINPNLDPKGVKIRESCDSVDNPSATPVIVAIDVTGSMGMIADTLAKAGLGTLFNEILRDKPITDPHLMFMAIGDANCDQYPLQVSQFEADNRIVEQLTQIFLEKGGGGNNFESYNLAWYFAARHTAIDSMTKRGKRGYLFTVGDEEAPRNLTAGQIKQIIGDDLQADVDNETLLAEVQRSYDVFHIVITEGNYAQRILPSVMSSWTQMLGQRVIKLDDHTKLGETIFSAIAVSEGGDADAITNKWGAKVHSAVRNLPVGRKPKQLLIGATA